jgi:hypothetical protein
MKKEWIMLLVSVVMLTTACSSSDEAEALAPEPENPQTEEPAKDPAKEPTETPAKDPVVVVPKARMDVNLTAEGSRINDAVNPARVPFSSQERLTSYDN